MLDVENFLEKSYGGESYYASYDSIVQSFGYAVLLDEMLGSYQGDLVYVLYDKETDRWGFYVQGYGSCSYCDQLEHMEMDNAGVEEYRQFQREAHASIDWYESAAELYEGVRVKDGEWYWHEDGYTEFVEKFKERFVHGLDD